MYQVMVCEKGSTTYELHVETTTRESAEEIADTLAYGGKVLCVTVLRDGAPLDA